MPYIMNFVLFGVFFYYLNQNNYVMWSLTTYDSSSHKKLIEEMV